MKKKRKKNEPTRERFKTARERGKTGGGGDEPIGGN